MIAPLPSAEQRGSLCEMFSAAFIEIRSLGRSGRAEQATDLAEVFHEIPREMLGWGSWDPDFFRSRLLAYQAKYHGKWYEGRINYVKMFDEAFANK